MAGYLWTTGVLFALITLSHVMRMFAEPRLATDPGYLALTVAAAGFSVWAGRLLLSTRRSLNRV